MSVRWFVAGSSARDRLVSGPARQVRLPLDGSMSLEEMDRCIIRAALAYTRYNVAATARLLHTTRDTLRYRIRKYGIALPGQG